MCAGSCTEFSQRSSVDRWHRTYRGGEAHWRPGAWHRLHQTDDTLFITPALQHTPSQHLSPISLLKLLHRLPDGPQTGSLLGSGRPPLVPPPKKYWACPWAVGGRGPRRRRCPPLLLCDSHQGRASNPPSISSYVQLPFASWARCLVLLWWDILSRLSYE